MPRHMLLIVYYFRQRCIIAMPYDYDAAHRLIAPSFIDADTPRCFRATLRYADIDIRQSHFHCQRSRFSPRFHCCCAALRQRFYLLCLPLLMLLRFTYTLCRLRYAAIIRYAAAATMFAAYHYSLSLFSCFMPPAVD